MLDTVANGAYNKIKPTERATMNTAIDFEAIRDRARNMTLAELHYSRIDCVEAAEAMDTIDREDGGDRAGRYRDEAGIYAVEMRRRHK